MTEIADSYTAAEFDQLFEDEDGRVERKTGTGLKPIQESMVAFSNAAGGVIFVGVEDDGTVVGRNLTPGVEDRVHQAVRDGRGIGRYKIKEVVVGGVGVVAIEVERRHDGFAQTSSGRVLVRRGSSNTPLFDAELLRFINERSLHTYEGTYSGVHLEAVDSEILAEVASAFGWENHDLSERLSERGLADRSGDLTIAGALLLSDASARPGFSKMTIDVRRHPGDDELTYDRRVEISGPLHHQVQDATTLIMNEVGSDFVVSGLYRHELPRVPEVVIREAIANAVCHRSYETRTTAIVVNLHPDRVVITSPGGLPEPVTVANIREAQAARNPAIIDALRRLRLAEDAGRGIDVMQDEMLHALLDPPEFEDLGHAVRVVLPTRGSVTAEERAWITELELRGDLRSSDRLVVVHAAREEAITNASVRELLGIRDYEARLILERLTQAGILERHGLRGGTHYTIVKDLRPKGAVPLTMDDIRDLLVEEATHSPLTNARVREIAGLSRIQSLEILNELVEEGRLARTGAKRGTKYHAV
ncbi:MAG: ATP-binding protein [Acidimicrobiia bacterium]|nr:ATP-binding protein [Acidimicrobiia bacterium]